MDNYKDGLCDKKPMYEDPEDTLIDHWRDMPQRGDYVAKNHWERQYRNKRNENTR